MPTNDPPLTFPVCGVLGGWRDGWDQPDDSAELRDYAEAIERRYAVDGERLGQVWQAAIRDERRHAGADERRR